MTKQRVDTWTSLPLSTQFTTSGQYFMSRFKKFWWKSLVSDLTAKYCFAEEKRQTLYLYCLWQTVQVFCMWIITQAKKHVPSALERLRAKNTTMLSFWSLFYIYCLDRNSNFTKFSQYKHNTELTTSTNKAGFQSRMCTCFLKKVILLSTFICSGNKLSYILKQTCSLDM